MSFRRGTASAFSCVMWLLTFGAVAWAAPAEATDQKEEKGFVFYERFEGSSNTLGQVFKLDTSGGYNFNKHLGVDLGIPVYFVRNSATSSTTGTSTTNNGIGNVYAVVRLTLNSPVLNYVTSIAGTAPTGDTAKGFSTGRATIDWNNHLDRTIWRLTPFANLGVANTISDTHFFTRPFSSLGTVGHFEGGGSWSLWHFVSVGASAYDILPSGQQKIFSKLVRRPSSGSSMAGSMGGSSAGRGGRGRGGVFTTQSETVGSADTARDNGYSAWLNLSPAPFLEIEAGYSRSVPLNLNTFSFTVGFNLRHVLRKAKGH